MESIPGAIPSTVRISAPSAFKAGIRHASTALPFMITVQAPHSPLSHPFFVPVRPRSSRSKSRRMRSGLVSTSRQLPFSLSRSFFKSAIPLIILPIIPGGSSPGKVESLFPVEITPPKKARSRIGFLRGDPGSLENEFGRNLLRLQVGLCASWPKRLFRHRPKGDPRLLDAVQRRVQRITTAPFKSEGESFSPAHPEKPGSPLSPSFLNLTRRHFAGSIDGERPIPLYVSSTETQRSPAFETTLISASRAVRGIAPSPAGWALINSQPRWPYCGFEGTHPGTPLSKSPGLFLDERILRHLGMGHRSSDLDPPIILLDLLQLLYSRDINEEISPVFALSQLEDKICPSGNHAAPPLTPSNRASASAIIFGFGTPQFIS